LIRIGRNNDAGFLPACFGFGLYKTVGLAGTCMLPIGTTGLPNAEYAAPIDEP
jgi:hypothetical protein